MDEEEMLPEPAEARELGNVRGEVDFRDVDFPIYPNAR